MSGSTQKQLLPLVFEWKLPLALAKGVNGILKLDGPVPGSHQKACSDGHDPRKWALSQASGFIAVAFTECLCVPVSLPANSLLDYMELRDCDCKCPSYLGCHWRGGGGRVISSSHRTNRGREGEGGGGGV